MDSLREILHQAFGGSVAEMIAAILSLAYLVLAMMRSLWCWACAFVSSLIYVVVFARCGLPMDALLSVYYVVMAVYGFVAWINGRQDGQVQVVRWTLNQHVLAIGSVLVLSTMSSYLLQYAAPMLASISKDLGLGYVQIVRSPWVDSFVLWGSVLTTWMVARRVLENWLYWVVVDSVAAGLYWARDLKYTAGLFVIYVGMVIYGYFQWYNQRNLQANPA